MFGRIEIRRVPLGFALRRRTWRKSEWFGEVPVTYSHGDEYHDSWNENPIYRVLYATEIEAREAAKEILRNEEAERKRQSGVAVKAAEWTDKGVVVGYVADGEGR